jgi:phenylacetic acid degradation operon negative regulatory protein
VSEELPAQRSGAKALLLTILGEFVLPTGGAAWTSSLVRATHALGINEKNARQAIARIADDGLIESSRDGRLVRWSLTATGRRLLESGAERIYEFGTTVIGWDGEWLVAHCPVPESQRTLRRQLRARLAFQGFGELSPSLAVSPHVGREAELRTTLEQLGLLQDSVVLRSRTGSSSDDADLVGRAWELDDLADRYLAFSRAHRRRRSDGPEVSFRSVVELVNDWRHFPFIDPELPTDLLPDRWAGAEAVEIFQERHNDWSPDAFEWFLGLESRDKPIAV